MSNEEIVAACMEVLKSVDYHDTAERHERLFLTAYQIWQTLKGNDHAICADLIRKSKGDFVGKNAGSHDGPVRRIANALGRCAEIETQYLGTRHLEIAALELPGLDCGIFRLFD